MDVGRLTVLRGNNSNSLERNVGRTSMPTPLEASMRITFATKQRPFSTQLYRLIDPPVSENGTAKQCKDFMRVYL
jgi:hypothetical protein